MTIQEQQNNDGEKSSQSEIIESPPKFAGESRRRFTKAGLAASGVILSLASKPGMACEICASPSGSLSGGLASHHGPAPTCAGLTPGYWKNHTSWPGGVSCSTPFRDVFHVNSSRSIYYSPTLLQVLTPQDFNDQSGFGSHLVACYLNVRGGLSSFLTVATLQSIFQEWQSTGHYTPSAGVQWDITQIVTYLSGTQG